MQKFLIFAVVAFISLVVSGQETPDIEPSDSPTEETPEVEPTSPPPTTPSTTTTTEAPEPCGLVGLDADDIVVPPEPVDMDLTPGTRFWNATMFNVNSTAAVSHAHNKYMSAFRQGLNYYFEINGDSHLFRREQGTDTMLRTVYFYCNGGLQFQYRFRIQVAGPDIEPTEETPTEETPEGEGDFGF